jgi:hypothetical protein
MTALHQATLDALGAAGQIDWSRASIDTMHVRAVKRGNLTEPSPVDGRQTSLEDSRGR